MFYVTRKVKQLSGGKAKISIGTAQSILGYIITGQNIWNAISLLGIAAGGGVASALSQLGRQAIIRMVKKVGKRKAAIW